MTIRELKRELRYLQSNDNLSDDAKVEIMIGGLDDRRLVKIGAATSETRVRSAVVKPFSMQSVTLEAEFNGEETLADHVSIGDRNMNNVEMEKDDDVLDIEQRRLDPPSFMGLMDVLMFGKYSFIFWIVFFIVSVPTFILVTTPSFFEHFTKNSQTDGIERPYKAPFEEDKTDAMIENMRVQVEEARREGFADGFRKALYFALGETLKGRTPKEIYNDEKLKDLGKDVIPSFVLPEDDENAVLELGE